MKSIIQHVRGTHFPWGVSAPNSGHRFGVGPDCCEELLYIIKEKLNLNWIHTVDDQLKITQESPFDIENYEWGGSSFVGYSDSGSFVFFFDALEYIQIVFADIEDLNIYGVDEKLISRCENSFFDHISWAFGNRSHFNIQRYCHYVRIYSGF